MTSVQGRSSEQQIYVGVDVGATKTAVVLGSDAGSIIASSTLPTPLGDPGLLVDTVGSEIARLTHEAGLPAPLRGMGVGICAGVSPDRTVHGLLALGWPRSVDLASDLEARTGLPVAIDNDANAGALGEHLWGAGRGFDDFMYLALGTGIGAGLVLQGKVYRGAFGFAGEIGHLSVDVNGVTCSCGNRGCIEASSSGKGLGSAVTSKLLEDPDIATSLREPLEGRGALTSRDVFDHALLGDAYAQSCTDDFANRLAAAITNVVNLLDLPRLVVGGGLADHEVVLPAITAALTRTRPFLRPPEGLVVGAGLGSNAAVMGALALTVSRTVGTTDRRPTM